MGLGRAKAGFDEAGQIGPARVDVHGGVGGHHQVRDEGQQPLGVPLRDLDPAHGGGGELCRFAEDQVQVADDRGQRGAELVRDGGDEAVLGQQGLDQPGDLVGEHPFAFGAGRKQAVEFGFPGPGQPVESQLSTPRETREESLRVPDQMLFTQ